MKASKLRVTGFVRGIHRWPQIGPVTRKMFPFDEVIMYICDRKPEKHGSLRLGLRSPKTAIRSESWFVLWSISWTFVISILLSKRSLTNVILVSLDFLRHLMRTENENKLYLIYDRIKSAANEIKYKIYLNKLNRILKFAERNTILSLLMKISITTRRPGRSSKILKKVLWNLLSKFKLSDASITCDKSIVSEFFYEFLTGIDPSLAKKSPNNNCHPYVIWETQ